jgi:hypothetical protein
LKEVIAIAPGWLRFSGQTGSYQLGRRVSSDKTRLY